MRLHPGARTRSAVRRSRTQVAVGGLPPPSIRSIPYQAHPNMSLLEIPDELIIVILLACEVGVLFTCKRVSFLPATNFDL